MERSVTAPREGVPQAPADGSPPGGTDRPEVVARRRSDLLPVVLAAAVVLTQIAYPLLDGTALRGATVLAVLLFAAASLAHATVVRGPLAAFAVLVVAGGLGLLAEAVGVRTGFPFGTYSYAGTLGPRLLGVPLVVPLAWTMMAYPCLLLGRRLTARAHAGPGVHGAVRRLRTAAAGGLALAAWDLYLDPQMVAAGHWTWRFPEPALPGVPGIPLTNYAGWLLVATFMVGTLDAVLSLLQAPPLRATRPDGPMPAGDERVPAALLAWTWLGSGLANLAFFGRPAVAGYGLLAMGVVVGPYLARLRTDALPADVSRTDVSRTDVSRTDVSRTDVPRTDVPRTDVSRTDVSRTDVPRTAGSRADDRGGRR